MNTKNTVNEKTEKRRVSWSDLSSDCASVDTTTRRDSLLQHCHHDNNRPLQTIIPYSTRAPSQNKKIALSAWCDARGGDDSGPSEITGAALRPWRTAATITALNCYTRVSEHITFTVIIICTLTASGPRAEAAGGGGGARARVAFSTDHVVTASQKRNIWDAIDWRGDGADLQGQTRMIYFCESLGENGSWCELQILKWKYQVFPNQTYVEPDVHISIITSFGKN